MTVETDDTATSVSLDAGQCQPESTSPPESTAATEAKPGASVTTVPETGSTAAVVPYVGDEEVRPEVALTVATIPDVGSTTDASEVRDEVTVPVVSDEIAVFEERCSVAIPDVEQDIPDASPSAPVSGEIASAGRSGGDVFRIANYTVYNTFNNCNVCIHSDIAKPNVSREQIGGCFPSESNAGCFPMETAAENVPSQSNSENIHRENDGVNVPKGEADAHDVQDATCPTPAGVAVAIDGASQSETAAAAAKKPAHTKDAATETEKYGNDAPIMDAKVPDAKAAISAKDEVDKVSIGKPEIQLAATFTADVFKTDICIHPARRDPPRRKKDNTKKGVGANTTRKARKDSPKRRGAGHRARAPVRRQAVIDYFTELNMGVQVNPKRNRNDKKGSNRPSQLPRPVKRPDPKKVIAEMMETIKPTTKTPKPKSKKIPVLIRPKKAPAPTKPEPESTRRPSNTTNKAPRRPGPQRTMTNLTPFNAPRCAPTQAQSRVTQVLRDAIWSDKPKKFHSSHTPAAPAKPSDNPKPKPNNPTKVETARKQPNTNEPSTSRPPPSPTPKVETLVYRPDPRQITDYQHYRNVIVDLKVATAVPELVDIAKEELDLMIFEVTEAACEAGASMDELDKRLAGLVHEYSYEVSRQIIIQVMTKPQKFEFGCWELSRDVFRMSPPLPYLNEGSLPRIHVKYPEEKDFDLTPLPPEDKKQKENDDSKVEGKEKEKKLSIFNKVKSFVADKLGIGSSTSTGGKQDTDQHKVVKKETNLGKAEKSEIVFSPPSTATKKRKPKRDNKFVRFANDDEQKDAKYETGSSAQAWVIDFNESTTPVKKESPKKVAAKSKKITKKPVQAGKKPTKQQKGKPTPNVKKAAKVLSEKKVEAKHTPSAAKYGQYSIPDIGTDPPPARQLGRSPLPPINSASTGPRPGSRASDAPGEKHDMEIKVDTPDIPAGNGANITARSIDTQKSGRRSNMSRRSTDLSPPKAAPMKEKHTVRYIPSPPHMKYAQYSIYDTDDKAPIPTIAKEIPRTPLPPIRATTPLQVRRTYSPPVPLLNIPRTPLPTNEMAAKLPMIAPNSHRENYGEDINAIHARMRLPTTPVPLPPIGKSRLSPQTATRAQESPTINADNGKPDKKAKGRKKRESDAGASAVGIPVAAMMARRSYNA